MSQSQAGPSHVHMVKRHWPPRLYLAVDCGGTKAAATICDEQSRILGRGRGGPSNYTDEGLQLFLASVEAAVKDALENVGRNLSNARDRITWEVLPTLENQVKAAFREHDWDENCSITSGRSVLTALRAITPDTIHEDAPFAKFDAAWFGIAGVDSPGDITTLSPHLARLLGLSFPSSRLIVANDTSLLASPIADTTRPGIESGIVAIAGTGSIVMSFRRSRSGMLKVLGRMGGLGWLLGDEGSGYLVGRMAIRKVLDLADQERLSREGGLDGVIDESSSESSSEDEEEEGAELDEEGLSTSSLLDEPIYPFSPDISADDRRHHSLDMDTMKDLSIDKNNYGCLLRDRILQEWGLSSTDELLRAVYYEELPIRSPTMEASDSTIKSSVTNGKLRTFFRIQLTDKSQLGPGSPSLEKAQNSLNLLPPTGSTIDEETRLRGRSPIPSLSSSLSDTNSALLHNGPRGRVSRWHTGASSTTSTASSSDITSRPTCDRKHRLASLTPLVFHLAFAHGDEASMDILQSQAHKLALQIQDLLQPSSRAKAHLNCQNSVLCLGGALVGQASYRALLLKELSNFGINFSAVEYVADPATRGAEALSKVVEQRMQRRKRKS